MLRGNITVKLDGTNNAYSYTVVAIDTPTNMTGIISSYALEPVLFLGDNSMDNALEKREFVITQGTYKVQQIEREVEEKGKKKMRKAPINNDFFSKLGALISYCKQSCNNATSVEDNLIADASGSVRADIDFIFNIPKGILNEIIGTVVKRTGSVVKMDITTDMFEIHLEEDGDRDTKIFEGIYKSTTYAFKFDTDTLGFPVRKPVVAEETTGLYSTLAELIEAHPDKDFHWLRGRKYEVVRPDNMEEILNKFYKAYEENPDTDVFFDTETTGLDINFKSRTGEADVCVGIILSIVSGESYYFPLQMRNIENMCGGDHVYFMTKYIKPILEKMHIVVFHGAFDWKVAYIYGIDTNILDDIYVMNQVTFKAENPNFAGGLKDITWALLHRNSIELDDINKSGKWGGDGLTFDMLSPELTALYACPDTDNLCDLLTFFRDNKILETRTATQVYQIELKFSLAIAYQEFWGHCVDKASSDKLRKEINYELAREKAIMEEIAGKEFNPNSSKVLLSIMYDELGIPEQLKDGRRTADKDSLKELSRIENSDGKPMYPFVHHLLNFRKADANRKLLDHFDKSNDGFLFSGVIQFKSTGRVSITDPNYQSYNDTVKHYVIPRPGFYMVDTDYSSVESRVMSCMAGNKALMEAFVDPDFDFHRYQAARMFGVPYECVTPEMRKQAKGIDFGLPYGMGDANLGKRVYGKFTPENTAKAKYLREKFFEGQEDILYWFEHGRDLACQLGYSVTHFNRRRYFDKTKKSIAKIRREAGNALIQGTAADIYKIAIGRVFDRIRREGWLGKVLITGFIHDEGLFEIHNSINSAIFLKALREEFEVKIEGWCPLYMGFGYGRDWKEAKKTEIPIQLQWEWVEKYGETGYPFWDGNCDKLMEFVHSELDRFQVEHIAEDITAESSQGLIIKPHITGLLTDVFYADNGAYLNAVKSAVGYSDKQLLSNPDIISQITEDVQKEIMTKLREGRYLLEDADAFNFPTDEQGNVIYDVTKVYSYIPKSAYVGIVKSCIGYSDKVLETPELQSKIAEHEQDIINAFYEQRKVLLSNLPKTAEGMILSNICNLYGLNPKDKVHDIQKLLDMYCNLHSIDRSTVNVLSPQEESNSEVNTTNSGITATYLEEDNGGDSVENLNRIINSRLSLMGVSIDADTESIYLKLLPSQFLPLVRNLTVESGKGGYRLIFRDIDNRQDYLTDRYILAKDITAIQTLYTEVMKELDK